MRTNISQTAQHNRDDLLSIPEAFSRTGIPVGTLRYWIYLRILTSYKLGRRRKIKWGDLLDFIEKHREEAIS